MELRPILHATVCENIRMEQSLIAIQKGLDRLAFEIEEGICNQQRVIDFLQYAYGHVAAGLAVR